MAATGNDDSPNTAALFEAANKLRGSVESAEYRNLVLGLIFLKCIALQRVLRSWSARFGNGYLTDQTYLAPFPPALVRLERRRRRGRDASGVG